MAKRRIAVPKYSQFLDVVAECWQPHSGGVVALKIVMDSIRLQNPTVDKLIMDGLNIHDAYDPKTGWTQEGLTKLARRHHLRAGSFNWSEKSQKKALAELKEAIQRFPCIASVYEGFRKRKGGDHPIVVTRISASEVFYHDPASHLRMAVSRRISIERFTKGWKQRVIIVKG